MNKFKGTKGKWFIGASKLSIIQPEIGLIVAYAGSRKELSIAEQEANAQLIASAPELLEALIEFKRLVDEEIIIINENTDDDHANYLYNKVSKAINKALVS